MVLGMSGRSISADAPAQSSPRNGNAKRLLVAQLFLPFHPVFEDESVPVLRNVASSTASPSPKPVPTSIVEDLTLRSAAGFSNGAPRSGSAHRGSPLEETLEESVKESLPRSKSSAALNRQAPHLPLMFTAPASDGSTASSHHRERDFRSPLREPTPVRPSRGPPPAASLTAKMRRRRSSSVPRIKEEHSADASFELLPNPHTNGGLRNAILAAPNEYSEVVWIGTPGCDADPLDRRLKREIERRFWSERQSLPVWVADEVLDAAYLGQCKSVLFPLMHYSLDEMAVSRELSANPETEKLWQTSLRLVNDAIADRIIAAYEPGDLITLHGYHLAFAAERIRQRLPKAAICFTLHIAWPTSELFRCLPERNAMLKGILGADMVCLQTFQHARHFRITVARLLGLEVEPRGVHLDRRLVAIEHVPIGIDLQSLRRQLQSEDVLERCATFRDRYKGLKLIVSRDKLETVKGVKQKLLGYERFLDLYPEEAAKVVMVILVSGNSTPPNLSNILTRINSRHGSLTRSPLVWLHQEVAHSAYLALLKAADVFISTSLRDGMGLTCHEYVVAQEGQHGPLVLSEFAGTYTASTFRSALAVNPFDTVGIARSLHLALHMSREEAEDRWKGLWTDVSRQTAQKWVSSVIRRTIQAASDAHRPSVTPFHAEEFVNSISSSFKSAQSRLMLVDADCLLPDAAISTAGALKDARDLLSRLAAASTVYLFSSQAREALLPLTDHLAGVGWVCENGCEVQLSDGHLVDLTEMLDLTWRSPVLDILNYYADRTVGAKVADLGTLVQWDHAEAKDATESAWATRQATEAQNGIIDSLGEKSALSIINTPHGFLVGPRKISRATAAAHIFAEHSASGFDLIVVITADERLARFLEQLGGSRKQLKVEIIGVGEAALPERFLKTSKDALNAIQRLVDL